MNQYYRVYAAIDLDAICHNISEIKNIVGPNTKIMPVIKADGYGHGAVPVAKALNKIGVDGFAVAIIEEGIALRKQGITKPILILGYTSEYQYASLIQHEIEQTVFSYEMAEAISKFAVTMKKDAKIHIKVDTGMNRIGFKPTEESVLQVERIQELPNIKIQGIFTHFACADEKDKTSARHQKDLFDRFVQQLEEKGIQIPVKHVSNSAAIMDLADCRMDMVRSGIITYGLYPSEEVDKSAIDLRPALSLISHVIHVKEVEPGEGVSYGSTFITERTTKIATIPVGYADGYPRALSSKGRVIIRGQYAPIIGRICMDQFMVDVTDIEGVSVMDQVTLVGTDGDKSISVEEAANLAGSFNYEFVCGIGKRVPRVYFQNGKAKEAVDYLED
ncbi:alanine racemase [Anaerostipes sp.]|uniref:alanine racemase n=1 Tax=Anaerostipes sp. TaxID=1872530 RepID=UPI0025C7356A|nr:alanine racemase [Anaerostipes sp.]MBS7009317.1 alanine racemase [Anaerostipes sp.]